MKRNIKMIIAAAIVLAILTGLYFVAVKWEPEEESPASDKESVSNSEYLINEDLENVLYVKFNNGEVSYTIHNGEEPSIEGYSSNVIDNSKLSSALYSSTAVVAGRKVKESADLAQYGLDKEEKYILLRLKDSTEKKLIIGNNANFDGEYYAKMKDSDTVYTISSYTVESLLKNPDDYRSLAQCEIDNTSISSFSVEKNGAKVLEIVLDEDFVATNEYQPYSYLMKYPYNNVTANLDSLNMLFEKVSSVYADSIVEEKPSNLAQYGLDKPYVFTVKDASNTSTIKMGSYADDGSVYVMLDNIPVVYKAQCSFYEAIKNLNPGEYVDRFINLFNIDEVESIIVESKDGVHELKITKKSSGDLVYNSDGKIISEDKFKDIYQLIIGITSTEVSDKAPSGEEKCTVTFNFNDKTSKKFTYYIYSDRNCIVKADNGLVCLVTTKSVDEMLNSFN